VQIITHPIIGVKASTGGMLTCKYIIIASCKYDMLLSTTSCCSGPRGREEERGRKDRHLEEEVGFYRRDTDGDGGNTFTLSTHNSQIVA